MPPRPKPPRLWHRPAGRDRQAAWFILDRDARNRRLQVSLGTGDRSEAEQQLARYLADKHQQQTSLSSVRDPSRIRIADVLTVYARDVVPKHSSPTASKHRILRILDFFGGMMLGDINGQVCRRYAERQNTDSVARRDLEELKAAISHHRREGLHDRIVSVWLPPRRPARERFLTREEAARLLMTAWRIHGGRDKHIAKFILVALYSGRRASVVCGASFQREPGRSFIDLRRGLLLPPERVRQGKKRNPPIPLPDRLLAHLRRWHRNGQRYAVEWNGHQPIKRIYAFKEVARAAGLSDDVVIHTLRHTAASWLMMAGVNVFEASKYLGMSVRTLEQVYGHLRPEHLMDVRAAFSRPRPAPAP
jgi:integrase